MKTRRWVFIKTTLTAATRPKKAQLVQRERFAMPSNSGKSWHLSWALAQQPLVWAPVHAATTARGNLTAHGRQRLALPLQWRVTVCINPTNCGEAKGFIHTAEAAGKQPVAG